MNVLDTFAGIGGFTLGMEAIGCKTVAFCEIDPYATKVLNKNWPEVPVYDDIQTLTAKRDWKGAVRPETLAAKGRNPDTNSLPDAIEYRGETGRLNPEFVEWLMGFPIGHTELDA